MGRNSPNPLDRLLSELAAGQHGVVSLAQLRELGLTDSGARNRVARGRLHRLHRGVYAVGHPVVSWYGRLLAAVLACGLGAVLSHRSTAALLGLRPDNRRIVDVAVPRAGGRAQTGITAHRLRLHPDDITIERGIPCTTVARTLLDLAAVVNAQGVARAVQRAEELELFDLREVQKVLARADGHRGASKLLAALALDPPLTRNELEARFLAICRSAGVPEPRVNVRVEGKEVDFCWPSQRLIAETDGYATHGTRRAFRRDRSDARRLVGAGWRVVRFTWAEVAYEPGMVAAELRQLLA